MRARKRTIERVEYEPAPKDTVRCALVGLLWGTIITCVPNAGPILPVGILVWTLLQAYRWGREEAVAPARFNFDAAMSGGLSAALMTSVFVIGPAALFHHFAACIHGDTP